MTFARIPEKVPTGLEGFDDITMGGLPRARVTLVVGPPGSAKTVLGVEYLVNGVRVGEHGVFVTFEEPAEDIAGNVHSFGWDLEAMMDADQLRFVDASTRDEDGVVVGDFDLEPLIARIRHAAEQVGATRVVLDSVDALFPRLSEGGASLRAELRKVASRLREMGLTAVMTMGTVPGGSEDEVQHGMADYVADNIVVMRNGFDAERRRRTIEVLKMRGGDHLGGQFPFTIVPGRGIVVVPLAEMDLVTGSSELRVTSGSGAVDAMTGGGFFEGAIVLVSGATGTGKTLMTCHFARGAEDGGEKCLLIGYEESHDQILRNAKGWGFDFAGMEERGSLRIASTYPEAMSLQKHLIRIQELIEEFQPDRVALDSLSALERAGSPQAFREFVLGLSSMLKARAATAMFTNSTPTLTGGTSITETHISTLTDAIILLRYVEMLGSMRRGLTVLKLRGSTHDKQIHEFTIDGNGMHIGDPFRNITGILAGAPAHVPADELSRLSAMFEDGDGLS